MRFPAAEKEIVLHFEGGAGLLVECQHPIVRASEAVEVARVDYREPPRFQPEARGS